MPRVPMRLSPLRWYAVLALFAVLLSQQARPLPKARAEPRPDPASELELIESTERNEDPLGIDESTGKELDRAAAALPKPTLVLPSASQGAALSSIAGVRESAHQVQLKLDQGLAFVNVHMTFVSGAKHAAEIAYRLPLPSTGVVTNVRICVRERCSEALPSARTSTSQTRAKVSIAAESIEDLQGRALALRMASIAPGATLEAYVEYVAEAKWLGARARFRIEARGYDPNLAVTTVRVEAAHLDGILPAKELSGDPWTPLDVTASVPSKPTSVRAIERAPCGLGTCTRSFEASALGASEARPTYLLIDASPSMEGPARSRVSSTIAALLSVLPEATTVRAYAFAARASELGHFRAGEAPLLQLADATMLDLDAATQPSSALALARAQIARERPRIVVLSDGLFDATKREREALLAAQRQGAETWLLALGGSQPRLDDAFTHTLHIAQLAEAASHGDDLSPLEDALRPIAAKSAQNGLKMGEQRVREQRPKSAWLWPAHGTWLSYWMLRDQPPPSWSSPPSEASAGAITAIPYQSVAKPAPVLDTGLPKESVLTMLRTQLVPQARACLRTDRKGRANYAVGLAFRALFAQREVYEARVEGDIPRDLRSCLEAILPKLRVPAFSGQIRIRYPIYTEREAEPPVIELEPDMSQQLERAFPEHRALP